MFNFNIKNVYTRYWILDAGHWMLDAGYWMLDTGCWILDTAGYPWAHGPMLSFVKIC